MATTPIKKLTAEITSSLGSTRSEPSRSEWRPEGFDAYEPTLAKAVELARDLLARAEAHARRVREARAGDGPLAAIHDPEATWLTLSGRQGSGKTMLALALFRELRKLDPFAGGVWYAGTGEYRESERRPGVVGMHVNDFIDRTLGGWYDYPEHLGREWVVLVDDLGANRELKTTAIADIVYRLCNARLGKTTIFTTNLSMAEIAERFDPRVQSRLIRDGSVFHRIAAGDYAMRGATR